MELNQLEQEKISLTKQLERIQEEINSYTFGKIALDSGWYKELTDKKASIESRIKKIKEKL